jgi:hypothetical protein
MNQQRSNDFQYEEYWWDVYCGVMKIGVGGREIPGSSVTEFSSVHSQSMNATVIFTLLHGHTVRQHFLSRACDSSEVDEGAIRRAMWIGIPPPGFPWYREMTQDDFPPNLLFIHSSNLPCSFNTPRQLCTSELHDATPEQ